MIEATGDWFDVADVSDAEFQRVQAEHREAADAMLLGRLTYESFASYWPAQTDDETGVTAYLNEVQKYVVSRTIAPPTWGPTTVLPGDPVEEVTALKQQDGKDIVTTGSITLVHALVAAGFVDELRLFTYPVVVGAGRRLVERAATEVTGLHLVESRAFDNGVVLARYPAG